MTKVAAWFGVRLDRIAGRWDRFAETVSGRWYRSLDRIAGRWERIAETVSAPWYRSLDRIAGRWERIAETVSAPWYRSLDRIVGRWDRFTQAASDGWERVTWRLTNRHRGRSVRTPRSGGVRPRRRVVEWIAILALTGIVGLASIATLSALRHAAGERSGANDNLSGPGASSDRAVGGPGGMGIAPGERPSAAGGPREEFGAVRVYRDERTGYRFAYPSNWEVSASEGVTRLVDAAGEVDISFHTAPSGSIEDFSDRLVGILASRYAPLDIVTRENAETPQGEPSLILGGEATDIDGSSINFVIVTIEGPDRNRAITVRFSADSDLLDVSSSIRQIVGSFTASGLTTAT
jgi:hypothetical protein